MRQRAHESCSGAAQGRPEREGCRWSWCGTLSSHPQLNGKVVRCTLVQFAEVGACKVRLERRARAQDAMDEDTAPPALAPGRARADSLAVLLGQALRAGDQALLEKCAARPQDIGFGAGPVARFRTAPHQSCS